MVFENFFLFFFFFSIGNQIYRYGKNYLSKQGKKKWASNNKAKKKKREQYINSLAWHDPTNLQNQSKTYRLILSLTYTHTKRLLMNDHFSF